MRDAGIQISLFVMSDESAASGFDPISVAAQITDTVLSSFVCAHHFEGDAERWARIELDVKVSDRQPGAAAVRTGSNVELVCREQLDGRFRTSGGKSAGTA